MTARRDIIRVDDRVRIVISQFVTRVGYPKSIEDYEAALLADPEITRLLDALLVRAAGRIWRVGEPRGGHKSRGRIGREVAYLMAQRDGWGGPKRQIHWVERPELEGVMATVTRIRTAYTGTYVPPRKFSDTEDFELGYLKGETRHRLAEVQVWTGERLEIPISHLVKADLEARDVRGERAEGVVK